MSKRNWKEHAYVLFFVEGKNIVDISKEINVSRQHISKYLKSCEPYFKEKENRKSENKKRRKKYKYTHQKNNCIDYTVNSDTLRREHFEAVKVLSYERFF